MNANQIIFQMAIRTFVFDLNIGTKHRIVITTVAAIKKMIAVFTLSNIPAKSMFWAAFDIPPNPMTKYTIITIISRSVITQDKRPFFCTSFSIFLMFSVPTSFKAIRYFLCVMRINHIQRISTQILCIPK